MKGSPGIVFAGNVIVDSVNQINAWPERGGIVRILSTGRAVGGSVPNTGIDLCRLDPALRVSALADIGDDDNGAFACAAMAAAGMDVSRVRRTALPTGRTEVMALASTGERTFFCDHGAGAGFLPDADDVRGLPCDVFHLGYLLLLDALDAPDPEFGTKAARLLRALRERGIRTSVDLVSERSPRVPSVVRPVLAQCDYAVVNEIEAQEVSGIPARDADGRIGPDRLEALVRGVAAFGVRLCTVVHCPEGSGALDASGRFSYLPSLSLPAGWIQGAVGAGDAFCAGMLYSFLRDWDPVRGMRLARASAAANLASPSGTEGALSLDETLDLERRFGKA